MRTKAQVLQRAAALRSVAATRAARFASKTSTAFSRVLFVGLIAVPMLQTKTTDTQRLSEPLRADNIEIVRTRRVETLTTSSLQVAAAKRETDTKLDADAKPAPDVKPKATLKRAAPAPEKIPDAKLPTDPKETSAPASPAAPPKVADPATPPSQQSAPAWTNEEIASANKECDRLLDKVTLVADVVPPTREGACGAPAARSVKVIGQSKVAVDPPAILNCPMVAGLNTWLADKLQPAAQKDLGSPVTKIMVAASYDCRNRYGLARAPISEHAFMDAVDVSGFELADGRVITVANGWGPAKGDAPPAKDEQAGAKDEVKITTASLSKLGAREVAAGHKKGAKLAAADKDDAGKKAPGVAATAAFLHEVHDDACDIFGTVLGPAANAAHHDHFHLDMKARKYRAICE